MSGSSCELSSHSGGIQSTIAKASKLIKELSTNPITQTERYKKRKRKRDFSRQFQRNLVCIDYNQQHHRTLRDYNKVFEGFIALSSSMSEDDIREAIVSLLKTKDSLFHSFDSLTSNDFEFVKCVNRHIYIPDGIVAFDGNSILSLYRSGSAIYVRLTHSFAKVIHHKCNLCIIIFCHFLHRALQVIQRNHILNPHNHNCDFTCITINLCTHQRFGIYI